VQLFSYLLGTGAPSPGEKAVRSLRMNGAIPPASPVILHGVQKDILVFIFFFFLRFN
jgi:hypothetical protein